MAKQGPDPDDEHLSTLEFIAEARRPVLIARHRNLVEEMELSLADRFITGEADNPRLKALLKELDADSEKTRIAKTLGTLTNDHHYKDATLRDALIDELCLLREQGAIEIATLQMHVIGIYRTVRDLIGQRQGEPPSLAELRPLPIAMLGRLYADLRPEFGSPRLGENLVHTPACIERVMATVRRLRRAEGADANWQDAAGEPALSREAEEPLQALPEGERLAVRASLIRDRIRSRFYRQVFIGYLGIDSLDPRDVEAHPTVLHWLESIETTPHLYPFMQGQTAGQKAFRLAQLLQKVLQVHEMYARVALASDHPSYRDEFAAVKTRERLAVMAKAHYPPLALSPELTGAAMLCPFAAFVRFVQERVGAQDFVLPPDPKR